MKYKLDTFVTDTLSIKKRFELGIYNNANYEKKQ